MLNKKNKKKQLEIFRTKNGHQPFLDWLKNIRDIQFRARIKTRLDRLEIGHYGDYKALGKGIFELRLQFGSGYRIYFGEINNTIILLALWW